MEYHYTLFVINGTKSSQLAEEKLREKSINYKVRDLQEEGALGFMDRDLGIHRLPALFTPEGVYEGYESIENYLQGSK